MRYRDRQNKISPKSNALFPFYISENRNKIIVPIVFIISYFLKFIK